MAWAEDRAPWRHDLSADPGTKTEGGAARCRPVFPFGIGTKATNRRPLIAGTEVLISRPRFLHFTLNHYTFFNRMVWTGRLFWSGLPSSLLASNFFPSLSSLMVRSSISFISW